MENWPPVNPIGPFDNYCDGFGTPGAAGLGYLSTMKIATGVSFLPNYAGDVGLAENIVAYDKAEKNGSYIGQINMGDASSFCGTMGRLWGYDLAVAPALRANKLMELEQYDGSMLPVYGADALLNATQELFGIETKRRFPPAPGAYVLCANKSAMSVQIDPDPANGVEGVNAVWCYLAISITNDRNNSADLFVEDAGTSPSSDPSVLDSYLKSHVDSVANSIVACGTDQSVTYKETFIGWTYAIIPKDHAGVALTCAPYITLAKNAVVGDFDSMIGMPLADWSAQAGPGVGAS